MTNPYRALKPFLSTIAFATNGLSHTIAGAAMAASCKGVLTRQQAHDVRMRINILCAPFRTERVWLMRNVGVEVTYDQHAQDVQDYRHRWLDHLADEFDKTDTSVKYFTMTNSRGFMAGVPHAGQFLKYATMCMTLKGIPLLPKDGKWFLVHPENMEPVHETLFLTEAQVYYYLKEN